MQLGNEDRQLQLLRQSRSARFTPESQSQMTEAGIPEVFIEGRYEIEGAHFTFYILDTEAFINCITKSRATSKLTSLDAGVFAVIEQPTEPIMSSAKVWVIPSFMSSKYEPECFRYDLMINVEKRDECLRMVMSEVDLRGMLRFIKRTNLI